MATSELISSWKQTENYLRDARAHISEATEAEFTDALVEFEMFLTHNELGLALEALMFIVEENQKESIRVLELLALAAANMGLTREQGLLYEKLTSFRGE